MCKGLSAHVKHENGEYGVKCSFEDGSHEENLKKCECLQNDDTLLPIEVMVKYGKLVWDIDENRRDEVCLRFYKENKYVVDKAKKVSKKNMVTKARKAVDEWLRDKHFEICEAIALYGETRSSGKFRGDIRNYAQISRGDIWNYKQKAKRIIISENMIELIEVRSDKDYTRRVGGVMLKEGE